MLTIKDIAKKANVSTGTVDRVIHNRPGVSKKTKEKVNRIIKEFNFEINKIASTLAHNKNYKIGVLIPETTSENDFWIEPKNGIELATEEIKAFRTQTFLRFFNQFDSESYIDALEELIEGDFDALLIAPVFYNESIDLIKKLDLKQTPYIFINIEIKELNPLSFIGQNAFKSGYLAGKILFSISHHIKEVFIPSFRQNINNHLAIKERIIGFKAYFEDKNIKLKYHEVLIPNVENKAEIFKILDGIFSLNNTCNNIYVPSSYSYIVANYIETKKLDEMKFIGYDSNTNNVNYLNKEIINYLICQKPFDQGYKGIKLLNDFLLLNKEPDSFYYSPLEIITKENLDF